MKPYKVLLFIACVMVCLGALCLVLPGCISVGDKTLRWPTLAEVFDRGTSTDSLLYADLLTDTIVERTDTIIPVDTIVPEKPKPVEIPKVAVDSTTDSRVFLHSFYAAL